jgi:ATP-binding cassette subfamily C (CFTR/MRP) protein 1
LDDAPIIPDVSANFLSLITFHWIQPIVTLGHRRSLEPTDLWALDESRSAAVLSRNLLANFRAREDGAREFNARFDARSFRPSLARRSWWKVRSKIFRLGRPDGRKEASLAWALSDTFYWRFWTAGLLKVVADTLQTTAPLVTKRIINFSTDAYFSHRSVPGYKMPSIGQGIGLIIGLFAMQIIASLCLNHYFARSASTGVLARAALISAIYQKALVFSPASRAKIPSSKIVNHIGTDVSRIDLYVVICVSSTRSSAQTLAIVAQVFFI